MTFGIFTSYDTPYFEAVAKIAIPVLAEYCERHGYHLDVQENPPVTRTIVWDRVLTMLANLDKFDFTIHFDADILVTNLNITLESIVAQFPDRDLILARDYTGPNDGMTFSRPASRKTWERLWADEIKGNVGGDSSLGATWRYLAKYPEQTEIGEVPQKLLHSYPYAEYGIDFPEGTWEPGDFCCHWPGMVNDRRVELMTAMRERIIR